MIINLLVLRPHKKEKGKERKKGERKQENWGRVGRWKLIVKMINILRRESFNWRRPLFKMEKIVGRWSPQLKKFFTKGEGLNCRSCICIIWNYSTDKANVYPSQGNNTAFKSIVSFCCVGEPFCKTVFLLIRRTVHTCVHLRVCKVCVLTRGVCHKIKKNNALMWKGKMKSLLWKGKMKSLFLRQKEEGFLQGGRALFYRPGHGSDFQGKCPGLYLQPRKKGL